MSSSHFVAYSSFAFLLLILSACSGGGGNGTSNTAPIITSAASATVEENTAAVITVVATDADGDTLSYSLSGGTDISAFSIDTSSGNLSFVSAPDYESPTDTNSDNVYEVQVSVSDNVVSTSQNISVTVSNANDHTPVIISAASHSVEENATLISTINATDADGDNLTYNISGGVDQISFTIDAPTGTLSFASPSDYENPTDTNSDNIYEVQVAVSDGGNNTTQDITVTVTNLLSINAESVTHQPLDGTWLACYDKADAEPDAADRHFFSDTDFVLEEYQFESTDGSCTGQAMATLHWHASLTTSDDFVTSGWLDNADISTVAPQNQAGTGALNSNPTVTKLIASMGSTTPPGPTGEQKYFYYMDDTATTWCLYRYAGPDDNADGYADYVGDYDLLCKESGTITPLATTTNAESETMQLLDGVWNRQCDTDVTDFVEQIVVAAGTFKNLQYHYATSTNGSCSGAATIETIAEGTITVGDNFTTLGWHDGTSAGADAPIAKDGSGPLNATPTVTKLIIDIPTGDLADTYYNFFYIDDTSSTWWMYTDGPNEFPTVEYNEYLNNYLPYYKAN